MRTIASSLSTLTFWQDLVFLEAALLAGDETKALASLITPILDEFQTILQRDLDTRRGVIQASARAYVADADIDQTIRGLFSSVLAFVSQNRKRPEFTTLFPSHIGDIIRHALRKQIDVAVDLVDKLALKLYPDDLRSSQTKLLNVVIKRGKAVVDEVRKAEIARVDGRMDIQAWKDETNAARLTVYGQLLVLAAKNGRGKSWAEGFFPRTPAADSGGDAAEPTETVEPAAPAASDESAPAEAAKSPGKPKPG